MIDIPMTLKWGQGLETLCELVDHTQFERPPINSGRVKAFVKSTNKKIRQLHPLNVYKSEEKKKKIIFIVYFTCSAVLQVSTE